MQSHYGSPVKNTPNNKILDNYWNLGDYNRLPYRRGCLFAFWLDNRIAIETAGKYGARDFLLTLDKKCRGKGAGYVFTRNDFIEAASGYIQKDEITRAYDRYIIAGDPILFKNKMLLPCYAISYKESIPTLIIRDRKTFLKRFEMNK